MNDTDREDEDKLEFEYKKVDKRASVADDAEEPVAEEPVDEVDEAAEKSAEEVTEDAGEAGEGDVGEEDVAETAGTPEQPAADAEAEAAQAMMTDPYQLLRIMVGMFSEAAWVNLGLRVTPGAAEPEVKLAEAKLAIDTLVFVRDQLQAGMNDDEKREMENLISTLQMNYVRRA